MGRDGGKSARLLVCRDGERPPAEGAVAAIGNFDGIHLGHRKLIARAQDAADSDGAASAVLTFEPHPRDYFRPEEPAFRLTPEPVKLKILEALGVGIAFVRRFDDRLADTSAEAFVGDILAGELGLAGVVVGPDFHFGRGRGGTPAMLAREGERTGLGVSIEPPVEVEGEPVSSSRIRSALRAGDIAGANRLLGYRWMVRGEIVHGDKRGRTLGFPTANMALGAGCGLAHGIYAVRIAIAPGDIRDGVASFGRRPTFGAGAPLLETYLFDFAGDLYGREVEVEFLEWIRGEERFDSAEDLIVRMNRDSEAARARIAGGDALASFIG